MSKSTKSSRSLLSGSVAGICCFVFYKIYAKGLHDSRANENVTSSKQRNSSMNKKNKNFDHESRFETPKDSKYFEENEILKSDDKILKCNYDMYNGIRIFSNDIPQDGNEFGEKLEYSLTQWCLYKKRGIMLQIPTKLLTTHLKYCLESKDYTSKHSPFELHHSRPEYIMLAKWLPNDPLYNNDNNSEKNDDSFNMIPDFCHTYLGVGCLILNRNCECVVIQELWNGNRGKNYWKLPGGAVDRLEHIYKAAEREAFEETGLKVDFINVLSFRHLYPFRFGNTGDIYFLTLLKLSDDNDEFNIDPKEISQIKWIKLDEMLNLRSMGHMVGNNSHDNDENWEIRNVIRKECKWLVDNWDNVSKNVSKFKSNQVIQENNGCEISNASINGFRTFVPNEESFKQRFAKKNYQYLIYHSNTQ